MGVVPLQATTNPDNNEEDTPPNNNNKKGFGGRPNAPQPRGANNKSKKKKELPLSLKDVDPTLNDEISDALQSAEVEMSRIDGEEHPIRWFRTPALAAG